MAPPAVARAKLDAVGIDWLLEQIEEGRSYRQIAKDVGVSTMSLHDYLNDNPVHSARAAAAMMAGAEKYEQEAIDVLQQTYDKLDTGEPHPNGSALASLARERAQAAWRQASVRDPRRYSDRRTTSEINVTHKHEISSLPTQELERIVAQHRDTLQLEDDGSVSDPGG